MGAGFIVYYWDRVAGRMEAGFVVYYWDRVASLYVETISSKQSDLDSYTAAGYKTALSEERRRYCFLVERQCAVSKNNIAYHGKNPFISYFSSNFELVKREVSKPACQKKSDVIDMRWHLNLRDWEANGNWCRTLTVGRITDAHLKKAYAAEVQVTHLANTGSLLTAYLDSMLRVVTLPKPLALELCALSGTLLQISGFQGQALGRSLTGLVVARRQLWLTQARVPDVDHILVHITRCAFLPWPYIWTSGREDIATLSQKARDILAGSCDAPLPCLGMGKGEALVSGSYQSNLDYPGPDGTTERPEAPPPGLCGKEPAARTLLAQLHLRLLGASTVHTGYALQFHSGPPPFLRDYGHIRKRPFPAVMLKVQ
ncbi:UNVERIFIED_CONTAM: hypothetical protein FKN15_062570 [Acipenser sinensis]